MARIDCVIVGASFAGLACATAVALGAGVAGLYVYLYALLMNEDYAFLMGSIGLFAILALILYATRHVNWYQSGSDKQVPD